MVTEQDEYFPDNVPLPGILITRSRARGKKFELRSRGVSVNCNDIEAGEAELAGELVRAAGTDLDKPATLLYQAFANLAKTFRETEVAHYDPNYRIGRRYQLEISAGEIEDVLATFRKAYPDVFQAAVKKNAKEFCGPLKVNYRYLRKDGVETICHRKGDANDRRSFYCRPKDGSAAWSYNADGTHFDGVTKYDIVEELGPVTR